MYPALQLYTLQSWSQLWGNDFPRYTFSQSAICLACFWNPIYHVADHASLHHFVLYRPNIEIPLHSSTPHHPIGFVVPALYHMAGRELLSSFGWWQGPKFSTAQWNTLKISGICRSEVANNPQSSEKSIPLPAHRCTLVFAFNLSRLNKLPSILNFMCTANTDSIV